MSPAGISPRLCLSATILMTAGLTPNMAMFGAMRVSGSAIAEPDNEHLLFVGAPEVLAIVLVPHSWSIVASWLTNCFPPTASA
jgi:hypothetical protein